MGTDLTTGEKIMNSFGDFFSKTVSYPDPNSNAVHAYTVPRWGNILLVGIGGVAAIFFIKKLSR